MLRVGLTGGIASGKSSVAARLRDRGAVLIDSDVLAREVVAPGTDGLAAVVDRFGAQVLDADGALDRPALGRTVFGDAAARADLEAIIHPRVLDRTRELMAAAAPDAVVVHDIPLLVELDRGGEYHLVVVVAAAESVRHARLVRDRGMSDEDASRRIAAQADDDARRRAADVWLANEAGREHLADAVDRLWHERLLPFDENLRAGRRSTGGRPPEPAELARLARRIRRQGELAGTDLTVETDDEQLILDADAGPTLDRALAGAGFVPTSEHAHASADPALDVRTRPR